MKLFDGVQRARNCVLKSSFFLLEIKVGYYQLTVEWKNLVDV